MRQFSAHKTQTRTQIRTQIRTQLWLLAIATPLMLLSGCQTPSSGDLSQETPTPEVQEDSRDSQSEPPSQTALNTPPTEESPEDVLNESSSDNQPDPPLEVAEGVTESNVTDSNTDSNTDLNTDLNTDSNPEPAEPAPLFSEVLQQVESTTEIPVRLPSEIPLTDNDELPIFVEAEADADSYQIYLSLAPNCRGATACSYGFFAARRTSDDDYYGVGEEFQESIPLDNGITGNFNPMMCGASCSPPVIEWSQEGVRYRIALKGVSGDDAEALDSLQALANSAIATQP
ncbi:MAG: hypothetical protein ACQERW_12460 [Cyanobacteriota bacterium]|nr:MAG: hypothetical protein EYR95_13615 [Phormidium sp. SL48-SHIP]